MILNTYHGTYSQWLEEVKPIRELQKLVRSTPKAFTKFVKNTVFASNNYLFFDVKKTSGHCSACSHDIPIHKGMINEQKIRHKAEIICPDCGKRVSCISDTHYSKPHYKNQLEVCKWSIIPEENDGWLILRYIRHVKTFFTKDGEIKSKEVYRTFWNESEKVETAYQTDPFDRGMAWVPYKDPSFGFWNENTDYVFPNNTYVYDFQNLSTITANTWARYSGFAEYFSTVLAQNPVLRTGWEMEKYLELYLKKPAVEQLAKCGFHTLIKDLIANYWSLGSKLQNATNIVESLQIDKNCFNFIREQENVSFNDIDLVKDFEVKTGRMTSREEFEFFSKHRTHMKFLYEFMQHKTIHKLNHYFLASEQRNQPIKMCDYIDYFGYLKELHIPLDNSYLFPKDFQKAHDKRCEEVKEKRDKEAQEKRRKEEAMYQELIRGINHEPVKSRDLVAIYPSTLGDLKKEGENLHHCVGNYCAKVATGETTIIFIRKNSAPQKSYFTMEYKNGSIEQVRGYGNCDANRHIMAFAKKVAAYLESQKPKQEAVA